jgi:DNA polymerase-1
LCNQLGKDPEKESDVELCQSIIDHFFEDHPQLKAWIYSIRKKAVACGYVESIFGKRRNLPDLWHYDKKLKNHALKQAGNFVVQSVAASITKRAMIELYRKGFDIVNQVHDSITCMVKKEEAEEKLLKMSNIMRDVVKLSVPLEVDGKILNTFKE